MLDALLDTLQRGGALMWPLFVLSVAAVAMVGERLYALGVRWRLDLDQLVDHVVELLEADQYARALEVLGANERHPFAVIAKAGLMKANGSERDIQRAMEAQALRVLPQLTRRSEALAVLANVATLIGLLGTVLGLIEAFAGMTEADAAAKQEILARGIAVAMFTTAAGLSLAILALAGAAFLRGRERALAALIEAKSAELLGHLVVRGRLTAKRAG